MKKCTLPSRRNACRTSDWGICLFAASRCLMPVLQPLHCIEDRALLSSKGKHIPLIRQARRWHGSPVGVLSHAAMVHRSVNPVKKNLRGFGRGELGGKKALVQPIQAQGGPGCRYQVRPSQTPGHTSRANGLKSDPGAGKRPVRAFMAEDVDGCHAPPETPLNGQTKAAASAACVSR